MHARQTRMRWAVLLLAAALVWVGALVSGPHAVSRAEPDSALVLAGRAAYALGSVICHQKPDRSFHVAGTQLPVCARCTGLYLLTPVGLLLALEQTRRRRPDGAVGLGAVRRVLAASAAPTVLSVGAEALGVGSWSNIGRAIAALPLGLAVAWAVGLAACGSLDEPTGRSAEVD